MTELEGIDWADPKSHVTANFTVRDAIFLPHWGRLANESDGLTEDSKLALVSLFRTLEAVRAYIDAPMIVHCGFRPTEYNDLIGGAKNSAHIARIENTRRVAACDWHPSLPGMDLFESCTSIKKMITPMLETWGLRMESGTTCWIHLDTKLPGAGGRIFDPKRAGPRPLPRMLPKR